MKKRIRVWDIPYITAEEYKADTPSTFVWNEWDGREETLEAAIQKAEETLRNEYSTVASVSLPRQKTYDYLFRLGKDRWGEERKDTIAVLRIFGKGVNRYQQDYRVGFVALKKEYPEYVGK